MNLKAIILIAGFFILILNKLVKKNEETIVWQEGRLLTWNDFKGKPAHRNSVASTSYDILKEIKFHGDSVTVLIQTLFFPERSWRRKGRSDEDILKHEQGHFDITEIYARKLRSKIKKTSFQNMKELKDKLNLFGDQCDAELDVYQDNYDRQTDHSRNGDAQRKWNDKLKRELEASAAGSAQSIHVHFSSHINSSRIKLGRN